MNGDILWREFLLDDTVEIGIFEVREGNVRAVQKRQPVVVVFKVKAAPQTLRHLMQETEHALVVAPPQSHFFEMDTHTLAMDPVDLYGIELPFAFDFEQELGIRAVNLKIDEIANFFAI